MPSTWWIKYLAMRKGYSRDPLLPSDDASVGFLSSRWDPFAETRQALGKVQSGTASIELAGEDLAKRASLTALTQRWLKGSSMAVVSTQARLPGYVARIHLASGLHCRLMVVDSGGTAASCGDSVRGLR